MQAKPNYFSICRPQLNPFSGGARYHVRLYNGIWRTIAFIATELILAAIALAERH